MIFKNYIIIVIKPYYIFSMNGLIFFFIKGYKFPHSWSASLSGNSDDTFCNILFQPILPSIFTPSLNHSLLFWKFIHRESKDKQHRVWRLIYPKLQSKTACMSSCYRLLLTYKRLCAVLCIICTPLHFFAKSINGYCLFPNSHIQMCANQKYI